jgi:hypothetical protein
MRPAAEITAIRPIVCDSVQRRNFLFVLVETDVDVMGSARAARHDLLDGRPGLVHRTVLLDTLRERPGLGIDFDETVARRHEVAL